MSKIEWCDKTWNVITGCSSVSEACRNCYARSMHKRLHAMYLKNPSQKGVQKYSQPFDKVVFHEDSLKELEDRKKYPSGSKIFINSMSDTFHQDVKEDWVKKIFSAVRKRKDCDFLFLTKRVRCMINIHLWAELHALPDNALFGVTIENQEQLDLRFKILPSFKQIKDLNKNTRIFLSCEPLLSELDFGEDLKYIDWVIVGGESVPNAPKKARAMKAEWVQKLYKDCKKAGVPFFFKQWGNAPRETSETYEFETCKEFYKGAKQ